MRDKEFFEKSVDFSSNLGTKTGSFLNKIFSKTSKVREEEYELCKDINKNNNCLDYEQLSYSPL